MTLEQSIKNRLLVPEVAPDWFAAISTFYRAKHSTYSDAPIFSCNAAEQFPQGWQAAFRSGFWPEEGPYGDNFRMFFGLVKTPK